MESLPVYITWGEERGEGGEEGGSGVREEEGGGGRGEGKEESKEEGEGSE